MPQCPTLFCCVAYKWGHGTFGQPCYNNPTDNVVVLNWNEKRRKLSRVKLRWVQVTWTLRTRTEYTLWKIMGNNSSSLPEYWLSPPSWSAPITQRHLKVISHLLCALRTFKPINTLHTAGRSCHWLIGVLLTMFLQTKTLNKLHQRWHLLLWNGHHYILIWVFFFFFF